MMNDEYLVSDFDYKALIDARIFLRDAISRVYYDCRYIFNNKVKDLIFDELLGNIILYM